MPFDTAVVNTEKWNILSVRNNHFFSINVVEQLIKLIFMVKRLHWLNSFENSLLRGNNVQKLYFQGVISTVIILHFTLNKFIYAFFIINCETYECQEITYEFIVTIKQINSWNVFKEWTEKYINIKKNTSN